MHAQHMLPTQTPCTCTHGSDGCSVATHCCKCLPTRRTVLCLLPCCQGTGPLPHQLCQSCPTSIIIVVYDLAGAAQVTGPAQVVRQANTCPLQQRGSRWNAVECKCLAHQMLPCPPGRPRQHVVICVQHPCWATYLNIVILLLSCSTQKQQQQKSEIAGVISMHATPHTTPGNMHNNSRPHLLLLVLHRHLLRCAAGVLGLQKLPARGHGRMC